MKMRELLGKTAGGLRRHVLSSASFFAALHFVVGLSQLNSSACYASHFWRNRGQFRHCQRPAYCYLAPASQLSSSNSVPQSPQAAVDFWTGVVAREPNNGFAYAKRAACWEKLNAIDKANDDLSIAIRIEPWNVELLTARAELLLPDENRREQALDDVSKALEIQPNSTKLSSLRGIILAASNRADEALVELNHAAELNPRDDGVRMLQALLKLGSALNNATDEAALQEVDDLATIAKGPDLDGLLILRATVLYGHGRLAEAMDALTSYIGGHPAERETAAIYSMRAEIHRCSGQFAAALDDFNTSIRLKPNAHEAYTHKAWLLATCANDEIRDGRLAVDLGKRAVELSGSKPRAQEALAAAYAESGEFDQAVEWQSKALMALETPAASQANSTAKRQRSFGFPIWPSPSDPKAKAAEKRESAIARLDSYRQHKPWRE